MNQTGALRFHALIAAALSLTLLGAAPAHALLYSTSGGYRYTVGSRSYWGPELWAYGDLRFPGGWYPYGQISWSRDAYYDWILAPSIGLAKGIAGVGKFRAGYTLYRGGLKDSLGGTAHGLDLGASRAFSERVSGDIAYRLTSGNLFGGENFELNAAAGQGSSLRHAVFHQAILGAGVNLLSLERPLRLDGQFSFGSGSLGLSFCSETLLMSLPIHGPFSATASVSVAQSSRSSPRGYFGMGLSYSFSGRLQDKVKP